MKDLIFKFDWYDFMFSPDFMPMWGVFVLILGACVGSFLNVCIWRLPRDESLFRPRSYCPRCGRKIGFFENLPMLSWILLRGKCRKCGEGISFRYFLVELLTTVLFFLIWRKAALSGMSLVPVPLFFVVTMLLVVTIFVDFEHRIIPNEATYTAMAFGLVYAFCFPRVWGDFGRLGALSASAASMLAAGGFFALLAWLGGVVFRKEALGWGDVKFLAAIGACLGGKACFFTVFFGSLTGSVAGLLLMIFKGRKEGGAIPFGPFMACGSYLWILYSAEIMSVYHMVFNKLHH